MDTQAKPEGKEPDFYIGYDFGLMSDLQGFQNTLNDYGFRNQDTTELILGWQDGTLDSWINQLRGDLRAAPVVPRAYLMAAIANIVIAFHHKDGGAMPSPNDLPNSRG